MSLCFLIGTWRIATQPATARTSHLTIAQTAAAHESTRLQHPFLEAHPALSSFQNSVLPPPHSVPRPQAPVKTSSAVEWAGPGDGQRTPASRIPSRSTAHDPPCEPPVAAGDGPRHFLCHLNHRAIRSDPCDCTPIRGTIRRQRKSAGASWNVRRQFIGPLN